MRAILGIRLADHQKSRGGKTPGHNRGGLKEAIEDGVTGLIVPPGNSAALAAAMIRLLENPELAARLGREGQERVRQRFSLDAMVHATEDLYQSLIEKQRRVPRAEPNRARPGGSV